MPNPNGGRPLSIQVGGTHYKDFEIQPVEFATKNKLGFLQGCMYLQIQSSRWKRAGRFRKD